MSETNSSEQMSPEKDADDLTDPTPAQIAGEDASSAPEEASESRIPGDPRPPHAMQPPTKEEY